MKVYPQLIDEIGCDFDQIEEMLKAHLDPSEVKPAEFALARELFSIARYFIIPAGIDIEETIADVRKILQGDTTAFDARSVPDKNEL
jgi:hypothetical protein